MKNLVIINENVKRRQNKHCYSCVVVESQRSVDKLPPLQSLSRILSSSSMINSNTERVYSFGRMTFFHQHHLLWKLEYKYPLFTCVHITHSPSFFGNFCQGFCYLTLYQSCDHLLISKINELMFKVILILIGALKPKNLISTIL